MLPETGVRAAAAAAALSAGRYGEMSVFMAAG
jgi:hypothetical protein